MNCKASVVHYIHETGLTWRAAAGGDNDIVHLCDTIKCLALKLSEILLAVLFKYLTHGHTLLLLYKLVQINEL